jgi:hypothetical protein
VRDDMTADQFNDLHPVGTRVIAYPGCRPEPGDDDPCCRGMDTRTRSVAWPLGHGEPVVMVDGYPGGIALTHIDIAPGD